jgi:MiaB-like tRNA modifying enzyme
MKTFFVEGYGCSLNVAETENIVGFFLENGFRRVFDFKEAEFVVINTCSVKSTTEQRMLSRIRFLLSQKKASAKLIVFGCLASSQKAFVQKISPELIVLDTKLSSLCSFLNLPLKDFSPEISSVSSSKFVSIIPVSVGCLGSCSYCSARLARRELSSYSIESIDFAFKKALSLGKKEFWITSQDLGCYGFDIGTGLPALLKVLLKNRGEFRVRLGMMNPNHFKKIRKELMPLFSDSRLYKFLHLPLQSGSNRILKSMNRMYSVKDFIECVSYARKFVPGLSVATDVIVGFPGESEKDFRETVALLKKVRPSIVNISRFGKRKGTVAEKFPLQLSEEEKKGRSRRLTVVCDGIFAEKNKKAVGKVLDCLVS